jgi:hypothetical protein
MRENRTYGSEGGETGTTGLPYPYSEDRPTGTELHRTRATCVSGVNLLHRPIPPSLGQRFDWFNWVAPGGG